MGPWLISLLVLGLLVLVHELGHFLVARWLGVRVVRFSIGFGPQLWTWRRGTTEYAVSLLPFGGYVKLAGERRTEQTQAPDEFLSKSPGLRAWIVVAGPLVNAMLSMLTLWITLVIGYPELLPTVGRVVDKMPAQTAGIQSGDRVLAVDDKPIRTWDELTGTVHRAADRPLAFLVDRKGTHVTVTVTPTPKQIKDPFGRKRIVGLMGIAPSGAFGTYRVSPLRAVKETLTKQLEWLGQIGLALWSLFAGRISPQESLTGPLGIIYMTSEAARLGFSPLLYLVSLLSLSLAVCNLFPIPVLDGGHLMFLALEKLRGTPVSLKVQEQATKVSLAMLIFFVVFICINDVNQFGLVKKLLEWWRG